MSERLYQIDSYRTDFEALVTELVTVEGRSGVVLDATLFYPESGGQPCDTGTLGGIAVEGVVEEGARIIHLLAREPGFAVGERVKGIVDWRRRFINMQQHTGQHILSQAFEQVLDAATVSSSLGTEHSTIDVSRLDLKWEDMAAVERLANQMVYENRAVRSYEASREDAGEMRVKRSAAEKKVERGVLRIVEVSGFDRSPCGGTHLKSTGETGHIKILRWERVRETTRVEFVCGLLAGDDYFWKNRFVVDLAQRLTTKDENLPKVIDGVLEDNKALRREAGRLRSELTHYRIQDLRASAEEVSGISIITASFDMRDAMKAACEVVGGRGGGRPEVAQGGGDRLDLADEAMERALCTVRAGLADMG